MNEVTESTEQPRGFDISEEFKVTDLMEEGKNFPLSEDAWIKVRSTQSAIWRKNFRKALREIPDVQANNMKLREKVVIQAMATHMLLEWENIRIGKGPFLENTVENRIKALKNEGFRETVWKLADEKSNFQDDDDPN